jgi:hypothetical protein
VVLGAADEGKGGLIIFLRNEANFSRCWSLWIRLMEKVLGVEVGQYDTWLRFAKLASFWGLWGLFATGMGVEMGSFEGMKAI